VFAVAFASLAWLVRAMEGHWLRPGSIFTAIWAGQFIGVAAFLPSASVGVHVVLYIASAAFALTVGSWTVDRLESKSAPRINQHDRVLRTPLPLYLIPMIGFSAGCAAALATVWANGLGLAELTSIERILATGNAISVSRYSAAAAVPASVPPMLGVLYASAILSPFVRSRICGFKRTRNFVLPFLGATIYSAVSTQRLALILVAVMLATSYVGASLSCSGSLPIVRPFKAAKLVGLAALCFALFTTIAYIRVGGEERLRPAIAEKLPVYAFGHLPAYSRWSDPDSNQLYPRRQLRGGAETFSGVPGVVSPRGGSRAYEERAAVTGAGHVTNVFTSFRGLLEDFGVAGSLMALFCIGGLTVKLERILRQRPSVVVGLVYAAILCFLVLTPIQSPFMFTVVVLAYVGALIVAGFARRVPVGRQGYPARHRGDVAWHLPLRAQ
jgi:oligosaccharide repeat unit polymerase